VSGTPGTKRQLYSNGVAVFTTSEDARSGKLCFRNQRVLTTWMHIPSVSQEFLEVPPAYRDIAEQSSRSSKATGKRALPRIFPLRKRADAVR